MQYERLEIIRLNPSGDAKRQIVCLAGRVSVFRARLDEEISLYADVLCGKGSAERFSVMLDGLAFDSTRHLFIGFDPVPLGAEPQTIHAYLSGRGFADRDIEPQLLSHGLGGLSQAPCAELHPVQQRMLQMIVALQSGENVLVLNDPFAEMAEKWREQFAQEIAEHAWKKRMIIVVVRLGNRPDVWIDNEYVSRIQLEKPRERTIGFGGGELSSADFMQALRDELKKSAAPATAEPEAPAEKSDSVPRAPASPGAKGQLVRRVERPTQSLTAVPKAKPLLWQKPVQHAFLAAAGLLMAIILLSQARNDPPTGSDILGNVPQDGSITGTQTAAASSAAAVPAQDAVPPALALARADGPVLERYPAEIKDAVLKAFREPKSALQNIPAFKPAPKPESVAAPAVYQPAQPEAPPPPPSIPETAPLYEPNTIFRPDSQNEEELEAQRQQLRQHFLEAVARARERQLQENGFLPQ